MSRWERGTLEQCSVPELERWASGVGARVILDLRVGGERLLVDARHAELQRWLVETLRAAGWTVEAEVSFNHYGDRGRVDVLAYYTAARILLVVEIKTGLDDIQDLLGRLDVRRRIAPGMAAERGWPDATIVPALIVHESRTARRRLAEHSALFDRYALRARAALAWLHHPRGRPPTGVLLVVSARRWIA